MPRAETLGSGGGSEAPRPGADRSCPIPRTRISIWYPFRIRVVAPLLRQSIPIPMPLAALCPHFGWHRSHGSMSAADFRAVFAGLGPSFKVRAWIFVACVLLWRCASCPRPTPHSLHPSPSQIQPPRFCSPSIACKHGHRLIPMCCRRCSVFSVSILLPA